MNVAHDTTVWGEQQTEDYPDRDAIRRYRRAERRSNRIGWACIALGVILFWLIVGAIAWHRWAVGATW